MRQMLTCELQQFLAAIWRTFFVTIRQRSLTCLSCWTQFCPIISFKHKWPFSPVVSLAPLSAYVNIEEPKMLQDTEWISRKISSEEKSLKFFNSGQQLAKYLILFFFEIHSHYYLRNKCQRLRKRKNKVWWK